MMLFRIFWSVIAALLTVSALYLMAYGVMRLFTADSPVGLAAVTAIGVGVFSAIFYATWDNR